jgi:S-DNA-T family DNA segregation ATPase FtsK/SpoIIIE
MNDDIADLIERISQTEEEAIERIKGCLTNQQKQVFKYMKLGYINSEYQAGVVNHADQTAILISQHKHEDNHRVTERIFLSNGITLPELRDKKLAIEKAFNCHVITTKEKIDSKEQIVLYTAPADKALPQNLHWHDDKLSPNNFELVLGENLLGREIVNVSKIPHILLGGASGSGKTVLLKSLIMQCVKKGARMYIADFKGGVDFPYHWRDKCTLVTQETDLVEILETIIDELDRRKGVLSTKACTNIDEYNAKGGELNRYIFACDEIAEILDKTGLSKDRKPIVEKIEAALSLIARQGRAFGIHLIISTQRPDHTILSGQIRSNIPYRVCGRANKNLSEVILENTDAADQIPHDAQGRFITSDGVVFQGYMINEDKLNL